ncbi:MAG: DNA polymerase III subunit delta' [Alphaproteobacteria bacterium]|nr:DNA polymerase III subunit delta' [Alphaproteobacteria bacterium]
MESFEPKDNAYLAGHSEAEKFVLEAWRRGNLHQALLISGAKGIGKATFAYRVARFLLSADETKRDKYTSLEVSAEAKVFKQISSESHPDFKVVERGYIKTDKQKIIKAVQSGNYMSDDELRELKKSGEIVVDDVRAVNEFLSKSSADGNWRVVLIDSVDEMNRSAANAVLKILEEPPHKTIMLLVSHNPKGLLPTIRSRCAKLELKPLSDSLTASLLRRYRSELSESEIKQICAMAEGSIGKAIVYADGKAAEFYKRIYDVATGGKNFRIAPMLKFCAEAASETNYELFKELILKFLTEQAKAGNKVEESAEVFDKAVKIFREQEAVNMDKRQVVTDIMTKVARIY